MAKTKDDDLERRVGKLEDEIKQRDRRIDELKTEVEQQRNLIERFREHAEDYDNTMESWAETFHMTITEDGKWSWQPFWDEHNALVDRWNELVRDWNKFVPKYNATIAEKRGQGRPLNASEAQVETVRKLHKRGMSLRDIMIETSLTFATVRTIVGQIHRTDRTTQKHRERLGLERIKIDRDRVVRWKRQRRTGNALPRRAQAVVDQGRELVTEAKGLGRAK